MYDHYSFKVLRGYNQRQRLAVFLFVQTQSDSSEEKGRFLILDETVKLGMT